MSARIATTLRIGAARVRPASSDDIDALCDLLATLFDIEPDFAFDATRAGKALGLLLEDDRSCVFTALHGGEIAGMCSGQIVISTSEGGPAVLIEDVVVNRKARGLGLGRELLHAVECWARERGASRLQLLADRNNANGLSFYAHLGWHQTNLICLRRHPTSGESAQGEHA